MKKLDRDDIDFMFSMALLLDCFLTFCLFVVREEFDFDFDCSKFFISFGIISAIVILCIVVIINDDYFGD